MLRLISSVICLGLLLVACGGGEGADNSATPPTIAAGTPPAGSTGMGYPEYIFTVSSGGLSPFTWSETGALPPGLSLSLRGELTGTPVTAGTYPIIVQVVDSSYPQRTASLPVSLKIDDSPLVIGPGQNPPAGVHGTPYSFTFSATGGSLPLRWAITAGTLPPGLTLDPDGTLSGTPTAARSTPFAFTVTVTETDQVTSATNSVAYTIAISDPPPPTFSALPPTATVGSPYSFQFLANDGLLPLVWTAATAPMGGLTLDPNGVLSGTPTTAGIFPITVTVTDALNRGSPATPVTIRIAMARPAAASRATGDMSVARNGHTATRLLNGQVLIAGGSDGSSYFSSAELYDPPNQRFIATGSMTIARIAHSATLLANSKLPNYGKVLVVGGGDLAAELFDPASGTFTATGSMLAQHLGQTATLLQNGQILIAGGETAKAELFNPSTGAFSATGSMTVSRSGHTATLLSDGRVLIAGGVLNVGAGGTFPVPAGPGDPSAELYDPIAGTFTSTGIMSEGRVGHTATLLVDGTVLITGTDDSAELFHPASGTFSVAGGLETGLGATATLRNDGTVLVAGGVYGNSLATANLFAPESGGFVATGSLTDARSQHTATLLADGTVLIAGGTTYSITCVHSYYSHHCTTRALVLSSAELFK